MNDEPSYRPERWAPALLYALDPGWGARVRAQREWERKHPWRARWRRARRALHRLQVPIEWRGWDSHR